VEIIRKHVKRIDRIVESVLDHSRPGKVKQMEIHLQDWLSDFIETFRQSIGDEEVHLTHSGESISVYFDPTQLEQILTNLCQNSIKYGKQPLNRLEIYLCTGKDKDGIPYLDVMNNGAAIPDEIVDNLFEPFFTTHSRSTGLGLYLSKEFCMLNGADFEYFNDTDSYGFRITFKMQETIE
jgi:two-component system sensor histidine kinase PilS (NtrC family)